jgi:FkbM family methyltransferase
LAGLDWFLYRLLSRVRRGLAPSAQCSFSQNGEDLIARFAFNALKVAAPTYLDIGAHHPTYFNNTRLFYDDGARGVNVEPDPELFQAFELERQRDTNLNVGVGEQAGERAFYVMSSRTLNTFSEQDARNVEREGKVRIERVVTLPVVPVNTLMATHYPNGVDFLSLDVEGMDLAILRSFDFDRYRPKLVCVETITYSERRAGKKIAEIAEVMQDNGYFSFADTYVNTLFVDRQVWRN